MTEFGSLLEIWQKTRITVEYCTGITVDRVLVPRSCPLLFHTVIPYCSTAAPPTGTMLSGVSIPTILVKRALREFLKFQKPKIGTLIA